MISTQHSTSTETESSTPKRTRASRITRVNKGTSRATKANKGYEQSEFDGEGGDGESPLSEEEEMELASDLLEIQSEEELDHFIGGLVGLLPGIIQGIGGLFGGKRRRGAGEMEQEFGMLKGLLRRRRRRRRLAGEMEEELGGVLKGMLKSVARRALPGIGSALGSAVAPGIGSSLGGALGSALGGMFEMEMEGLNPQDQEFEQARRFVELAVAAGQNAAAMPEDVDPRAAAQQAIQAAAQGQGMSSGGPMGPRRRRRRFRRRRSGRWIRRGNRIVLYGV